MICSRTPQPDDQNTSSGGAARQRLDTAHATPQPVLKRKARTKKQAITAAAVEEASPVKRKLTKQERKALRKRLERERQQRERSQHKAW